MTGRQVAAPTPSANVRFAVGVATPPLVGVPAHHLLTPVGRPTVARLRRPVEGRAIAPLVIPSAAWHTETVVKEQVPTEGIARERRRDLGRGGETRNTPFRVAVERRGGVKPEVRPVAEKQVHP